MEEITVEILMAYGFHDTSYPYNTRQHFSLGPVFVFVHNGGWRLRHYETSRKIQSRGEYDIATLTDIKFFYRALTGTDMVKTPTFKD